MKKFSFYLFIILSFKGFFSGTSVFDSKQKLKQNIAQEYNEAIAEEEKYYNQLVQFVVKGLSSYIDFTVDSSTATNVTNKTELFHINKDETNKLLLADNHINNLIHSGDADKAKKKLFDLINIWCNVKVVEDFINKKNLNDLNSLSDPKVGATAILEFKDQLEKYEVTTSLSDNLFFEDNYDGFIKHENGDNNVNFSESTLKFVLNALKVTQIGKVNINKFFTNMFSLTAKGGEWTYTGTSGEIFGVTLNGSSDPESKAVTAGIAAILEDINTFVGDKKIQWIVGSMKKEYNITNTTPLDATAPAKTTADIDTIAKKDGKYVAINEAISTHDNDVAEKIKNVQDNISTISSSLDSNGLNKLIDAHNKESLVSSNEELQLTTVKKSKEDITTAVDAKELEWQKKTKADHIHEILSLFDSAELSKIITAHNKESSVSSNEELQLTTVKKSKEAVDAKELEWQKKTKADHIHEILSLFDSSELSTIITAHNTIVSGDATRQLKIEATDLSGATLDQIGTKTATLTDAQLKQLVDLHNKKQTTTDLQLHQGPLPKLTVDDAKVVAFLKGLTQQQLIDLVTQHNKDPSVQSNKDLQLNVGENVAPAPLQVTEASALDFLKNLNKDELIAFSIKHNNDPTIKNDKTLQLNVGPRPTPPINPKNTNKEIEGFVLKNSPRGEAVIVTSVVVGGVSVLVQILIKKNTSKKNDTSNSVANNRKQIQQDNKSLLGNSFLSEATPAA
jgi:hypothetical protein